MENYSIVLREESKDLKVGVTLGNAMELSILTRDVVKLEFFDGLKMDVRPDDKGLLDTYKAIKKQRMDSGLHEVPIPNDDELISAKQAYTITLEVLDNRTVKWLSNRIKDVASSGEFFLEVKLSPSGPVLQKLTEAGYELSKKDSLTLISW